MHYSININNVILRNVFKVLVFCVSKVSNNCFSIMAHRSRLGCQIIVSKNFEGITLRVPKAHVDIRDL